MIRYLLDTDICIELIRGKSGDATAHLRKQSPGSVALSAITLAELQFGVANSSDPPRNHLALLHFVASMSVVSFDARAAEAYGRIRKNLELRGIPIGAMDTLIAAQAQSLNVTLVSNNIKEFARIPDLPLENWTKH